MAKFRKYYSKWFHHTLKLFVLTLHKPSKHPWKFPFVFQGSHKGTKVWCLTGGIVQVRIRKIRPLSHTLWLLIPMSILMEISNNTTASKWLTITVNYKTTASHPSYCHWCHWEGRANRTMGTMGIMKQWEQISKWAGYVYSEERKIKRKHDSPLQIFRDGNDEEVDWFYGKSEDSSTWIRNRWTCLEGESSRLRSRANNASLGFVLCPLKSSMPGTLRGSLM